MIKISERLGKAAALVSEGNVLADVGTDHGYVPIYLVQQKKIPHAIAMDIRQGPLARAREHIRLYQLEEYIQTRLSDGVEALKVKEADTILIAGVGGGLVMHILEAGRAVCHAAQELVLQPQSELAAVRSFLNAEGYVADAEDMVFEDGKYYPMLRVHYAGSLSGGAAEETGAPELYRYGRILLEERHPVLLQYLSWERQIQEQLLQRLKAQKQTAQIVQRVHEVEEILYINTKGLDYYK